MKKIAYFALIFTVLVVPVVVFLPSILSTPFGKSTLTNLISKEDKEVEFTSLQLKWLGPQVIEGLSFTDSSLGLSGHIQKITMQTELWNLFFSKKNLKKTLISQPFIELKSKSKLSSPEITSPQSALSSSSIGPSSKRVLKRIKKSAPFTFKGYITVEKGVIEVSLKDAEMIKFLDIEAKADIPTYSLPESFTLSCQTFQNNAYGKAHIKTGLTNDGLIEIQASAHQLPIRGIDNLISLEFPQFKGLLFQSVGATLDLKLEGLLSKTSFNLSLSANSPYLLAEIHTKKEGDLITFLSPANLSLNLSPTLLENILKLTDFPPLTFQSETQLHLKIPNFSLPLKKSSPDFSHSALNGQLSLSPTSFIIPTLDKTIQLISFNVNFASKDILDHLQANLDLTLSHLEKESSVKIQGELTSLSIGKATAHIHHFPTALLDKKHLYSLFLGNTLDLDVQSKWSEELATLQFQLSTPNLTIPQANLSIKDQLTLEAPISIIYTPPKQLLDFLKLEYGIPIKELSSAELTIDDLSLQDLSNVHTLSLKGVLEAKDLRAPGIHSSDLSCRINVDTLDKIHCEIESPTLQTELFLALSPTLTTLDFKKTIHLKYLVTQDLFHSLFPSPNLEPLLERPSLSDITIEPFLLPLQHLAKKHLLLKGKGAIDALIFESPHHTSTSSLEDITFKFSIDTKADKLTFDLDEKAKIDGQNSGTINLSLQLRDLFTSHTPPILEGKGQIKHLKTQVIDSMFGLKSPLLPILGPTLDLSFETVEKDKSVHFQIDAHSQYLKGSTAFKYQDDGTVSSNKPSTLQYTLTPEGLSLIKEMSPFETKPTLVLTKPTTINITLSHFSWPQNFDLSGIQGGFHLNSLSIQESEKKELLTLNQLEGSLEKTAGNPLQFSIKGKSTPTGELNITGTLHNLVNSSGNMTLNAITTDLDGEVRQFPSPFIDLFFQTLVQKNLHLTTLLGPTINATLKAQIEACCGDVHLNFYSDLAKASLDGTLKNGLLTLTAPLHAQFQVTQEMSELLLKKANPLGISSFTSNDPITLEISEKGFSLPIFPFQTQDVNIDNARLELGKITCENRGNLKSILKLLKSGEPTQDKTLELWFTPVDIRIHQGIADIERTEIFVGNLLELALWGTINFPKDHVNMILGLTAHTLQTAFHVKHLPSDYVLRIPLSGPTNSVSYDKVKATTKIASLLAWQHTSKEKSNDSFWDGLLQAVGTLPDKDAKNPPQKSPLPWDQKKKADKSDKKSSKKKNKKLPVSAPQPPPDPLRKNTNPFKSLFKALK